MTGQVGLLKKGPETSDDVADKLSKLMERWEQRITPVNRRFDERFLAGVIHVLIVFRDVETGEVWFVCLERHTPQDHIPSREKDEAVLVGIVEFVEQPQRLVATLVWLQRIDGLNSLPRHTLYASSLSVFITIGGMRHRELNVIPL